MKNVKPSTIVLSLVLFAAVLAAALFWPLKSWAGSAYLGNLTQVSNATATLAQITNGSFALPPNSLSIGWGGSSQGTNVLAVNIQESLDSINWYTVATVYPTTTNSGTFAWVPSFTNMPIITRYQAVTISNVYVGGTLNY